VKKNLLAVLGLIISITDLSLASEPELQTLENVCKINLAQNLSTNLGNFSLVNGSENPGKICGSKGGDRVVKTSCETETSAIAYIFKSRFYQRAICHYTCYGPAAEKINICASISKCRKTNTIPENTPSIEYWNSYYKCP
jgi:hypothetical protein